MKTGLLLSFLLIGALCEDCSNLNGEYGYKGEN